MASPSISKSGSFLSGEALVLVLVLVLPRAPASGSDHHDLNQEWETMDSLEPWAEAEIDRLQARFKLPDIDKT